LKLEKIGISLTVLWFTVIVALIFVTWPDAKALELNEWGDFLAGIFAPVAFLWLIVGYNLQRHELSLNTKALEVQGLELQRQAAELEKQTKFQEIQAELAEQTSSDLRRKQHLKSLGLGEHWENRSSLENNN
jgi:hypothetical protein